MSRVSAAILHRRNRRPIRVHRTASRLHNFDRGTRWVVCPDGESFGSYTSSHDSLARSAGYESAEQAYADGALRVHYDPVTNALRIEANNATAQTVTLAKQIIDKVPAALAHVAIGQGQDFRAYMGKPTQVVADISRNPRMACERSVMWGFPLWESSL